MTCSSLHSRSGSPLLRAERNLRVRTSALAGVAAAFVTAFAAPCAWAQAPNIALTPGENHPNSTIQVIGAHFGAYAAVDIYFDNTDEALAIANGNGAFAKIPIPVSASALPGTHYVTAVQRSNDEGSQKPFTVSTDWTQFKFDQKKKGYNPYENVIGTNNVASLDVDWTYQTGISNDAFFYPVAVADGTVYGVSQEGQVFALDGASGSALWTANWSGVVNGGVAVADGNVIACVGTTLYAMNASSGLTAWTAPLESACGSTPAVSNGNIFIGDESGDLYSFNGNNGAQIWVVNIGAGFTSPAVANGLVYLTTGRSIFAVSATYGTTVWSSSPNSGAPVGTPAVADGNVFVTTTTGDLMELDAANGYLWSEINYTSSPVYTSPVVGPSPYGPLVYFADNDANLFAVVPLSGALEWQVNEPKGGVASETPAIANGIVYATAGFGIYANDAVYGNVDWTALTDSYPGPIVVANGMAYFPSGGSNLYAFAINGGDDKVYKRHQSPPKISSLHPDLSLRPQSGTP